MEPAALALAQMEQCRPTPHPEEFAKPAPFPAALAVDPPPIARLARRQMAHCCSQIIVV